MSADLGMTELIWVGNTLYPRWLVFLAISFGVMIAITLIRVIVYSLTGQGD